MVPEANRRLSNQRLRPINFGLDACVAACAFNATRSRSAATRGPQENVEAVRKAAAQYGVIAYKLGADWNHVFRSMPADVRMNAEQKAMIAQAKSSKATIGVGMMLPLRAATVEYALTKGAGAQATSNEPAKIRLQLDEKMILTITRGDVPLDVEKRKKALPA